MAGPSTRPVLNIVELSAIAFISAGLPTISGTNDCRVGMSSALVTPKMPATAYTCHNWMCPNATSNGQEQRQQTRRSIG